MKNSKTTTPIANQMTQAKETLSNSKPSKDSLESVVKDTDSWRSLPLPLIWLVCDAWAGWKELTRPVPVKSIQYQDYDYDMQLIAMPVPIITLTKRCSQILRSSHQMRLTKLKSDLEGIKASIQTRQHPLDEMTRLQRAIQAAKETNTDPKWIKSQEESLEGWDLREAELKAQIEELNEATKAKELEMQALLTRDLSAVEKWSFSLGEIV
jgi:hypothetical protein